jgi:Asp-tRNA(Asn)/Glu-tRNA(Gln) amidotransferase B subunit
MRPAGEVVIGLEIHTQLATSSNFSGASTAYGQNQIRRPCRPQLPGVLPVLNKEVVPVWHDAFGLAVNATVHGRRSVFTQNYFYRIFRRAMNQPAGTYWC